MCQFTPQMINSIVLKSAHCLSNEHTWKDFLKKLVYNVSNLENFFHLANFEMERALLH